MQQLMTATGPAATTGQKGPTGKCAAQQSEADHSTGTTDTDYTSRATAKNHNAEHITDPANPIYVNPNSVSKDTVMQTHSKKSNSSHSKQTSDADLGPTTTSADKYDINLQKQRTDPKLAHMIDYLQHGDYLVMTN